VARKVTKVKEGLLYAITWTDHYQVTGTWIEKSEVNRDGRAVMVTIGMCLTSDAEYITMAGTYEIESHEEPLYSQVFRVAKANIVSVKEIKI